MSDELVNDLNVETLSNAPWIIAASARAHWARRRKIDFAELLDEPWLMPPTDTPSYEIVAEAFKARGLRMPTATLVTYSIDLRVRLSVRGRFITIVPKSMLRDANEAHPAQRAAGQLAYAAMVGCDPDAEESHLEPGNPAIHRVRPRSRQAIGKSL